MEIGRGSGHGTKLVLDYLGAAHVDVVDLDPQMIGKAERRLRRYPDRVRLAMGDATDQQGVFGAGGPQVQVLQPDTAPL